MPLTPSERVRTVEDHAELHLWSIWRDFKALLPRKTSPIIVEQSGFAVRKAYELGMETQRALSRDPAGLVERLENNGS